MAANARRIDATEVAKIIRRRLKATFPKTKFSVRVDRGSMHSSVDIRWTDGPTSAMVDAITGQYQGGGFDGMIDMSYYIDHWLLPDFTTVPAYSSGTTGSKGTVEGIDTPKPHPDAEYVHFSCNYVHTHRDYSCAFQQRALESLRSKYYMDVDVSDVAFVEEEHRWGKSVKLTRDVYLESHREYLSHMVYRSLSKRAAALPAA